MSFFKNPNDPDNVQIKEKIYEWMLKYLGIDKTHISEIEEIPCWEPNCPDIFTQITYLQNDKNQKLIIRKPLVFVRKIDFMGLKPK